MPLNDPRKISNPTDRITTRSPNARPTAGKNVRRSGGPPSQHPRRQRVRKKTFDPKGGAEKSLRQFRQASILAVVLTGFLLMVFNSSDAQTDAQQIPDTVSVIENIAVEDIRNAPAEEADAVTGTDVTQAASQAWITVRAMLQSFFRMLPRIAVALVILVLIWLLVKGVNALTRKLLGAWERTEGITTLITMVFWAVGIGLALSVVAGDIRALIGSLGLVGLALSWALQSPIESATGWLLNKFKGYYRVGDRVVVADVFGDVYKIDLINTTLWEIGDPFSAGFVSAEQPTGRLVTFPNSEILNGIVVNLTADFPYVWDELATSVANESDLAYAMRVIGGVANDQLGEAMKKPAADYERILHKAGLTQKVPDQPQLFLFTKDWATDVIVRYLVPARERRKWKSDLILKITEESNKSEHQGKIITVYPRQQVQFVSDQGVPVVPADVK